MTEGPGVQVKKTLVSSRFAENKIKEDEPFDLVRALQEAAGIFKGLTEDSLTKPSFSGGGGVFATVLASVNVML